MSFSLPPRAVVVVDVAVRMALQDRLKLMGALLGVVFATFLTAQQIGIFMGLVKKNTLLADGIEADVWIAPKGTRQAQAGVTLPERARYVAAAHDGVAWAEPLLLGGAPIITEGGLSSESVQLIGFDAASGHGGPWNVVAGDPQALRQPGAVFFDAIDRFRFGGMNLGSVREINGRRVQAVGFTSGLQPFGPTYAFADYDLALRLLRRANRAPNFVILGVEEGEDPEAVAAALAAKLPDLEVMTRDQYRARIVNYILTETQLGVSFGTSTIFALIVGFVIVGLTMFSGVVDNLREFGMLKAIGVTGRDLTGILVVQAMLYGLVGSGLGLAAAGGVARAIRSPELSLILPWWLVFGTPVVMLVVCLAASALGLYRLRSLEPAMVFR